MAQRILAPTTLGAFSTPFVVLTERQVTGIQVGMAAAELAQLQISPDGVNFANVVTGGVTTPTDLNVATKARAVIGPGTYRYSKGVTVAAVPIYVATEDNF